MLIRHSRPHFSIDAIFEVIGPNVENGASDVNGAHVVAVEVGLDAQDERVPPEILEALRGTIRFDVGVDLVHGLDVHGFKFVIKGRVVGKNPFFHKVCQIRILIHKLRFSLLGIV